jgi:transposase
VIRRSDADRRVLSTIATLSTSGQITTMHVAGSTSSKHIIMMLRRLLRAQPNGFVIVWDGGASHRSKLTKAFLTRHPEIVVERLPAYAPELNPEEFCHGNVKAHMRNLVPQSREHVRRHLNAGFRRLRRRKDLLLGFMNHAGLGVRQLWGR